MNRPPLNQSLKEKYFAAHWGQKLMCYNNGSGREFFSVDPSSAKHKFIYLLLRDVSSLTDAEAIEVAKMFGFNYPEIEHYWGYVEISTKGDRLEIDESGNYTLEVKLHNEWRPAIIESLIAMQLSDYLRSIGIALPYCGYSVSELIEAGWLKIQES